MFLLYLKGVKMFERLKEFVVEMNSTNSTNEKKEILRKYPDIQFELSFIYNSFIQFYVTSKNIIKNAKLIKESEVDDIWVILNKCSTRELTGHEAIATINGFIKNHEEDRELIYNIIDKDLKCRIGDSIINDVYPNLIPTFDVALANSYKDVSSKVNIFDGSWYASHKLDGCLSANTIVELKANGKKTIKEVVDNKIVDEIKCYDEKNKKVTYSPINGYGIDIELNETVNWYEIELEDGRKIKATSNHPFFLPDIESYRRTDKLTINDYLLID
mgnify:CR=1 FL=1